MWVMDVCRTPGPIGSGCIAPAAASADPSPLEFLRVRGLPTGGHLDEDVMRELAQILAAAFLRYQRVPKVREESEPKPQNELDTSSVQSPHRQ